MDVRLLGPVEASVDERAVAVGAGKPRALLAMLALHAGSTVSSDRLIDALWGERPPATAAKLVQLHVSQLRKALAAAGNGKQILTRGHGYELRLGPDELDVTRFQRLVASGRPREALTLWRGPALDDVAGEPFAAAEVRRLEELRLAAVELAIDIDLDAGRHRDLVGELEALVLNEPLREKLHAQRMLALYRSGRQADALAAYGQARTALVEQIGVEPGPELRRLHEEILRQDPGLGPPAARPLEPPPELDASTPLVGREVELDRLREHWRRGRHGDGRLVVIAGARGMGKTRLAAQLAAEVRDDGGTVLYASGAGKPTEALASAQVERRAALLVVDDAERAGAALRAALAEAAHKLATLPLLILATVEETEFVTGLGAAATLTLAPLDADAVRAVARSYAAAREDVEVPVERLARESGGVPQRVHQVASEWARTEAVRRLGATAQRATAERTGLRATEDDLAGNVVELQAVRERAERQASTREIVACPFKGLASFDVDDDAVFFGRERLVAEMVARIVGAPLVGIIGPSGSGKSSALRAGLLAGLQQDVIPGSRDWALALLRPGVHPFAALQQALAGAAPRGRLIVAVDQFEEVFAACRDQHERDSFVDALVACARDPRRRTLVLLAIRADFYGSCASYPELWRLLGANQVPVGPMRRDELRRAIELPAQRAGLQIEPELVDALVADVEGEPGALPLLSTSLLELWQHRAGRRLHLSAYEQSGGVHGAVARLAERAYEQLDPDQRDVARRVLLRLAGEGEGELVVRRRVALADFEGDDDAAVLSALANDRLVTIDAGEVEVAHEALLREWPRLRAWLDEDAQGRRLHQQLSNAAREWQAGGRDPGELYRGGRLASALDWAAAHEPELNAAERAFLTESRTASERLQRRLRAVLAGVAALLVLAVIAGVIALEQRGKARAEATAAEAQRLGAGALLDERLDRALLLARQAVALDDTVRTRGNLLGALLRNPAAIGIIRADHATILSAAVSPDGDTLAVGNIAGEVLFFDTRTRQRIATFEPAPNEPAIDALVYSPNGDRLAVSYSSIPGATAESPAGWRSFVALVDSRTRRVVRRLEMPVEEAAVGLQFSPDGRTLGVTLYYGPVPALRRFDARTGRRSGAPVPFDHPGRLTSDPWQTWPQTPVMLATDARRLVVGGADGVAVLDAATLRVLRSFPAAGTDAIRTLSTAYALSGDDRTLAIGGEDGSLRLLDLSTGRLQTASGRHPAPVTETRFTPDGRTVVTTGEDGDVILWDVRQAAATETLTGHSRSAFAPQIPADGSTLFTTSLDGTVLIWDLAGARRLGRPFAAGTPDSWRYSLSSDGRLLARGQIDGAVSIVDMRTLRKRDAFPVVRETGIEGPASVEGMAFVPGSHLLVVGGSYGSVALVDADRGRVLKQLHGHAPTGDYGGKLLANPIWTPAVSADGRLLATSSKDGVVRLWSLPDGRAEGPPLRFPHGNAHVALSPDGRRLAMVPLNRDVIQDRLEVWDVRHRERVKTLRPSAGVSRGQFSRDGRVMAVADVRGRVQVLSTATWKPTTPWFEGGRTAWQDFSPDGRTLATGNTDGTVRLWDIESGQALGAPLPGVPHSTAVPFFTPRGTHLIAAQANGRAYRWDIRPQSLVRQACEVAGRRLTRAEWEEFLPGRAYQPAC